MSFLKKKSVTNGHSRSGSASSTLNKHADPANIGEIHPSALEHKVPVGLKSEYSIDSSGKGSRKSSGGSTNSLTSEKLLFNWDVTDPSQWTMSRIVQWFRSNDFSDQWISYFKRNGISGNKFLKLLAYDNFAPYEKSLQLNKNSCYERFQFLLKKTLEENVVKGNNRTNNRIINSSRSASESAKATLRLSTSFTTHIRSTSESALLNINNDSGAANESAVPKKQEVADQNLPLRNVKTHSASALYRRSLISLRNASSTKDNSSKNDIKLMIPARTCSEVENTNKSPTTPSSVSPSHTTYTGIFRRQHKPSSSESSLFNSIFGYGVVEEAGYTYKTKQVENKRISTASTTSPASNLKQPPFCPDEKAKLWDKIKRKGQTPADGPSPLATEPVVERNKNPVEVVPTEPKIPDDMYPKPPAGAKKIFIMITKDNLMFSPFDISPLVDKSVKELKEAFALSLGLTHSNFTVHLTDFEAERGLPIPDDLLATFQKVCFANMPNKLFIQDFGKKTTTKTRARNSTLASQNSVAASAKSKISSRSNSSATSTGEGSSSDLTSIDDQSSANRRTYPQTPSYYYDTATSTETNYWSFKDALPEAVPDTLPRALPKRRPSLKVNSSVLNTHAPEKSTFRIIRKASDTDIDFNKRRESPYSKAAELAPKRKAPRPPINGIYSSSESIPVVTTNNVPDTQLDLPPKLERRGTAMYQKGKSRPPPPLTTDIGSKRSMSSIVEKEKSEMRNSPVQSFTPASTQIMVPQPYKGALETLKPRISSADLAVRPRISLKQFSRSNSSINRNVLSTSLQTVKRATSRPLVSSSTAADNFNENEISFADAPELSDSDNYSASSDEIIWSRDKKSAENEVPEFSFNTEDTIDLVGTDTTRVSVEATENSDSLKKMALRPSPDVVYQNLEKFFPDADLDNPILEGLTPPPSPNAESSPPSPRDFGNTVKSKPEQQPPFLSTRGESAQFLTPVKSLKPPKRTKTIRIIAQEASEARKNEESMKLRRKNTKMWGTKVVEITDKRMISINKSRNSRGEYKEFAWIKGEIIGKGSFGAVYLALNVTTGEMMAVKQVTVPQFSSQDESVISMVEALKSEVTTLKDLNHLNIVQYLGFEEKNEIYSLFLEYVAGGSVGSLIRMYGRFDDQLIRHLTKQVLKGLAYLHSKGILHRDMKADNLLLDNDGVCKISDFGISRKSNNIYSNSEMTMRGTVFWMAPEMVDTAHGYSAKVDIWSLGCVVLEMFAGKRPWSNFEVVAAMFQIGKSKTAPPIPDDTKDLVSTEGQSFLDNCFEIDPEMRPTADTLVSHSFCKTSSTFNFSTTKLAKFIRSNDKLNSSKLRISSQEL
ncbi:unnamed protein product [Kluyveromyces dobzhanskii CBS 2104]|uniref:WGS project CCBQ000000000 data, contig 00010 n=1 Tax=Kluyveromyces dobzhanskii CBS 2104 TaxID=1427455 RepID=A0A0A8LCX7_9SACH|nr:unnamed protein product [Kluyveromyces dobzhanskii CBS 2104]